MAIKGMRKVKWAKYKRNAQKYAQSLRKKGYHARVVKQSGGFGGYAVYSDWWFKGG